MALTKLQHFPSQTKLLAEKTDDWGKECIDASMFITTSDTSKIRKSREQKRLNLDLINGNIDEADIERAFNPMGIKGANFPAKIQNYPIEIPKFNVLKGEEAKRRFDWRLRSVNEDAISQKEFDLGDQINQLTAEMIQDANYNEEQAGRRLRQLEHYQNYTYQDYGEVMGTRVLEYFWHTQNFREMFSESFYDVLWGAEEIFSCRLSHGEPSTEKEDIISISTFGQGNSHKIEDSDIIVKDVYMPVGKVIDEFWDVLDTKEVNALEDGSARNRFAGDIVYSGPFDLAREQQAMSNSQLITVDAADVWSYNGTYDNYGNIRVTHVVWKSRRKVGKLKYYDKEGYEQSTIVDEKFPIEKFEDYGWEIDWRWINEWWQGYKIGYDMYKRIEPLPRIGTKMSNPSVCLPPYVGTIYRIGGEGISLMDRVKPYKYLYNVYMRRTELASARNKGRIAELDLAEIPEGWDEELVMMFAEVNGYMIKDSFSTAKKGPAQGRLVSTIKQRGSDVLQLDSADVIRANLELARYVKIELGEIAGISPQREGQIDNRETYGGIERAVSQSSHITEEWFSLHDNTKLRVLQLTLETAKYAWRYATGDNAKKLQYVDDGMLNRIFTVDGRRFAETEYGFYISDGRSDAELISAIKTLSQAALQNDKVKFKDIFSIYRDTSVSSMIRKLEHSEAQQEAREDDARREALESQERVAKAQEKIKIMEMEQKERIEFGKMDTDLLIEEMRINSKLQEIALQDDSLERDKLEADMKNRKEEIALKRKEIAEKSKQFYAGLRSQERQTRMQTKSAEKVAKSRPTAAVSK